ncbi:hypothetical protein [Pararhodobacter oceanensis]|uniref:hypothetical protein n=1 Tax=Pararhodobacter oceanensis TaxID=2172121 RepID=UPI000E30141B|nr:hypothetical protein [Pararhodobacter oceanensis]
MTRLLTAFALMILPMVALTGCVIDPNGLPQGLYYTPPAPVAQPQAQEPAYNPNFDATYDSEGPSRPTPEYVAPETRVTPPPSGAMLARQRAACTSDGGRFMARGAEAYACVYQTSDSGRQCDEASDCEGACLARSRTCAPMQPIFGCQEVFTSAGQRETVCTD